MAEKEKRNTGYKDGLKLKNGIYQYRFMYRGELQQGSCHCSDLKTAQKYLIKVKSELILNGIGVSLNKQQTFQDAYDYYIKSHKGIVVDKVIWDMESNMKHYWAPFAQEPLRNIQANIDDLHVRLMNADLLPSTVRCILTRTGTVLRAAWSGGIKVHHFKIPKVKVSKRRKVTLNKVEIEIFFAHVDAIAKPQQKVMIRALYYLGLRISECLRASWDDYNEATQEFTIDERQKNGEFSYLPVLPEMARWFATLERMPGQLMFPGRGKKTGKHDNEWTQGIIKKASEMMKLPKALTHHRLRASLATNLLRDGVAPAVVMQLMRHQKIDITMDHYWGGQMDDMRKGIQTLDQPVPPPTPLTPIVPLQTRVS